MIDISLLNSDDMLFEMCTMFLLSTPKKYVEAEHTSLRYKSPTFYDMTYIHPPCLRLDEILETRTRQYIEEVCVMMINATFNNKLTTYRT